MKYLNSLLLLGLLLFSGGHAFAQPDLPEQETNPETPAHVLLVLAEQDIKAANYESAAAKLDDARKIAVEPDDKGLLAYFSSSLSLSQNKSEEARAILDKSLSDTVTPGYLKPLLYTVYGDSYLKQGDYASARTAYARTLDDKNILDPRYNWYDKVSAWSDKLAATSKIAAAFVKEGKVGEARKTLQDFKGTTGNIVDLFSIDSELAKLEANSINEDEGISKYQQLLDYKVQSVDTMDIQLVERAKNLLRLDLAALYIKRKEIDQARLLYEQLLKSKFSSNGIKALAQKELAKLG